MHIMCNFVFVTKHDMLIHVKRRRYKDEYLVEGILDSKGPVWVKSSRSAGWSTVQKRTRGNQCQTSTPNSSEIRDFEIERNTYNHNRRFRCHICDLPCASTRGVKIHIRKQHDKYDGRRAVNKLQGERHWQTRVYKKWKVERCKVKIFCNDSVLDNVYIEKGVPIHLPRLEVRGGRSTTFWHRVQDHCSLQSLWRTKTYVWFPRSNQAPQAKD